MGILTNTRNNSGTTSLTEKRNKCRSAYSIIEYQGHVLNWSWLYDKSNERTSERTNDHNAMCLSNFFEVWSVTRSTIFFSYICLET